MFCSSCNHNKHHPNPQSASESCVWVSLLHIHTPIVTKRRTISKSFILHAIQQLDDWNRHSFNNLLLKVENVLILLIFNLNEPYQFILLTFTSWLNAHFVCWCKKNKEPIFILHVCWFAAGLTSAGVVRSSSVLKILNFKLLLIHLEPCYYRYQPIWISIWFQYLIMICNKRLRQSSVFALAQSKSALKRKKLHSPFCNFDLCRYEICSE